MKGRDIMASLRASIFESLGAEVNASEKPVVVYIDHQVSLVRRSLSCTV
jgi:hypothetical protein